MSVDVLVMWFRLPSTAARRSTSLVLPSGFVFDDNHKPTVTERITGVPQVPRDNMAGAYVP